MKTSDSVSKLRQKLYAEKDLWEKNIESLKQVLSQNISDDNKTIIKNKLEFCLTNLLKCEKVLSTVKRQATIKQKLAGWG